MDQPYRNGNYDRISAANPFAGMFPHSNPATDVFRASTLFVHYSADKCPCQEDIAVFGAISQIVQKRRTEGLILYGKELHFGLCRDKMEIKKEMFFMGYLDSDYFI